MNIFAVSKHPRKCARALDDVRLRKMILETAQMLCTAINLKAGEQVTRYKNSHPHNPLTKWAMSPVNWDWLYHLGAAMGDEYEHRFGKRHASQDVIDELGDSRLWSGKFPESFINAAANDKHGISFKHIPDVHKAYRQYLVARWTLTDTRVPTWTKRSPPKWH